MAAVRIWYPVSNIVQGINTNDCWAACTAMVMGRHSLAGLEHVKSLAAAAGITLDNGTLRESDVLPLAHAVHLRFWDFSLTSGRELTLPLLQKAMQFGPVVAFGTFNYPHQPQSSKHAVAIFGLIGTGSPRGTQISLMDPSSIFNPFQDDWEHFEGNVGDVDFLLTK